MARNKKPRKAHTHKILPAVPIVFALPTEKKNELQLTPHMCVEAFRLGYGSEEYAYTLASAINIGAVLCKNESDRIKAQIAAGLEAVRLVLIRGKSGKWGCSGTELTAITQAVARSDELQQRATRRAVRDAINHVWQEAA